MNKRHRIYNYLFLLTICILVVSILLPGCGGGVVEGEGETTTHEEEAIDEEELPIEPMHPSFSFSDLVIEPTRVICGEEVTINISITNISENQEKYDSLLYINGIEEEMKSIKLEPGTIGILTYSVVRDVAGTYDVEMSGLTGSFTVQLSEEIIAEEDNPEIPTKITTSGHITEDETWSGTVHITGEIFIEEGATVTVLPGTTVLFAAHQDDQHFGGAVPLDEWIIRHNDPTATLEYAESHIAIRGTLIARGTPEQVITFTSDSPAPDGGDWLHLHPSTGSIIEYCIIEYSRAGIAPSDSILISHNIIRYNLWTALTEYSTSSTITHNEIYRSGGHQGIAVLGEGATPVIAHNIIRDCKGGIVIGEGADPVVEYNTLLDNDFGISVQSSATISNNYISSPNGAPYNFTYQGEIIYPASALQDRYDELEGITVINSSPYITRNEISDFPRSIGIIGNSSPIITYNTITGALGGGGILFNSIFTGSPKINNNNIYDNSVNIGLQPGFTGTIDASNNWWGTTDKIEIEGKISDSRRDDSLGTVLYEPFLEEPIDIE